MTDWQAVADAGYQVPADHPLAEMVAELSEQLGSPDPVLRDQQAYSILATWIGKDVLDSQSLMSLGNEMAQRLDDPRIQARTFAPLILDSIVSKGHFDPQWLAAFERWYPAETDIRGYDTELGWLHAVAHGADLLGAFGRCAQVEPGRMLDIAVRRLLAPTDHALRDQEDDRLAHAMAVTLTRSELTGEQATGWLAPIETDFAAGKPGPVPAYASNTMRTLRLLYMLADRGVRVGWRDESVLQLSHRAAVKERIASVLAHVAPFSG